MLSIEEITFIANQGPYYPDWDSLGDFQVPQWFKKEKFGIFIHWGLYSIPAFNNEWYSRNMYIKGYPEYEHHIQTYGVQKDFGYQHFIPQFTAEKFNPKDWAHLIKESGAKYVFPVAEHHDGFQMYRSEISEWNSFDKGPKRDILGELKIAFEEEGIQFCTSSHRAEHWFFMGHGCEFESDIIKEDLKRGSFYWPAMPEPDNQDLSSQPYPTQEFLDDWLLRTCEIVDNYQPKLLYFDWWIQHEAFREHLKKFAAFYYNRGIQWGEEVGICYKHDAMMFGSGIVEIERGKFGEAQPFYWQTDTSIARNSWCYTTTLDYKEPKEIIRDLIEAVSKNGNMLLNIGPKGDGSIDRKDQQIISEVGHWLKINGEGIFESKPWRKSGEGPTKITSGQFQEANVKEYTSEDIRFTISGESLYGFIMNPSNQKDFLIRSLAVSKNQNLPEFHGIIQEVSILGYENNVEKWEVSDEGLKITCSEIISEKPIAIKIKMK